MAYDICILPGPFTFSFGLDSDWEQQDQGDRITAAPHGQDLNKITTVPWHTGGKVQVT